MYCFYTPMYCLIPPPEMCTQFGDPACISHHVCLSVSRVHVIALVKDLWGVGVEELLW